MRYKKTTDLPVKVREQLPPAAQEVYRTAHNDFCFQFDDDERAARVAWAAVQQTYEHDGPTGESKEKQDRKSARA